MSVPNVIFNVSVKTDKILFYDYSGTFNDAKFTARIKSESLSGLQTCCTLIVSLGEIVLLTLVYRILSSVR